MFNLDYLSVCIMIIACPPEGFISRNNFHLHHKLSHPSRNVYASWYILNSVQYKKSVYIFTYSRIDLSFFEKNINPVNLNKNILKNKTRYLHAKLTYFVLVYTWRYCRRDIGCISFVGCSYYGMKY